MTERGDNSEQESEEERLIGESQAAAQAETLRNALRGETRAVGDWDRFAAALEDDFNTPAALATLHEWARTYFAEEYAARIRRTEVRPI